MKSRAERAERIDRAFDVPMLVAALLVIPVLVIEESHGSSLGSKLRRFCDGTRFRYVFAVRRWKHGLGTKTISTLDRYGHLMPGNEAEAATCWTPTSTARPADVARRCSN